jgi:predicted RNA-binding protein with RPS1 domain
MLIKKYLYVPFEYKDDVKNNGAKWDSEAKKWYVYETNENYQGLIDKYHKDNFDRNGKMNLSIRNLEQRNHDYSVKDRSAKNQRMLCDLYHELYLEYFKLTGERNEYNYRRKHTNLYKDYDRFYTQTEIDDLIKLIKEKKESIKNVFKASKTQFNELDQLIDEIKPIKIIKINTPIKKTLYESSTICRFCVNDKLDEDQINEIRQKHFFSSGCLSCMNEYRSNSYI